MAKIWIAGFTGIVTAGTALVSADPLTTAVLGSAALLGSSLAASLRPRLRIERTDFPDVIPSGLPRTEIVAERSEEWLGAIEDGDDVLPPFPNMGQRGQAYKGPTYFDNTTVNRYRKD